MVYFADEGVFGGGADVEADAPYLEGDHDGADSDEGGVDAEDVCAE